MNFIDTYLEAKKISKRDFARMIGVTVGAVSHYCTGRRVPSPVVAEKIEAMTGIPFKTIILQRNRKTA